MTWFIFISSDCYPPFLLCSRTAYYATIKFNTPVCKIKSFGRYINVFVCRRFRYFRMGFYVFIMSANVKQRFDGKRSAYVSNVIKIFHTYRSGVTELKMFLLLTYIVIFWEKIFFLLYKTFFWNKIWSKFWLRVFVSALLLLNKYTVPLVSIKYWLE